MNLADVSIVANCGCQLGESPLWDHRTGRLYWIDSLRGKLHAITPGGQSESWDLPAKIGSVGLARHGKLLVALETEIGFFCPEAARYETFMSVGQLPNRTRLNDGKVCRSGRFWVGSVNEDREPTGSFYRIDPNGRVTVVETGVAVSNGIAFSIDEQVMYFADTPLELVWQYDHDPNTGNVSNRREFLDFVDKRGRPDGACVDIKGNYWVAMVRGGCVGCFSPEGALLQEIELPVSHPTMCSFGGENLDILYVSSTRHLLSEIESEHDEISGALFQIQGLNTQGVPSNEFGRYN